jgi:hypothetical protein
MTKKSLLILPALHVAIVVMLLCFFLTSHDPAKHHICILLGAIDWPISIALGNVSTFLHLPYWLDIILLIFLGTLWWYLISHIFLKLTSYIRKDS